jgi:hypothetical protein
MTDAKFPTNGWERRAPSLCDAEWREMLVDAVGKLESYLGRTLIVEPRRSGGVLGPFVGGFCVCVREPREVDVAIECGVLVRGIVSTSVRRDALLIAATVFYYVGDLRVGPGGAEFLDLEMRRDDDGADRWVCVVWDSGMTDDEYGEFGTYGEPNNE